VNDPIAPLLPWYATGRLAAAENARVEEHLAGCDECRELLALTRGFRRLAAQVRQETLFDHIHAQRLVEFAENPGAFEPEARRSVTSHLRECASCSGELEILQDIGRSVMAGDSTTLWERLSRTVLRPGPALAYLAAVLVLLVALPMRRPAPGPVPAPVPANPPPAIPAPAPSRPSGVVLLPPAIELPGEADYRDGEAPLPPVVVKPMGPAGTLVFSLVTDLTRDDLSETAGRFRVIVARDDRTVLDRECRAADFDRRGRLLLAFDPGTVAAGAPCLVRILRVAPGTASDGEEVYRRAFVIDSSFPPL